MIEPHAIAAACAESASLGAQARIPVSVTPIDRGQESIRTVCTRRHVKSWKCVTRAREQYLDGTDIALAPSGGSSRFLGWDRFPLSIALPPRRPPRPPRSRIWVIVWFPSCVSISATAKVGPPCAKRNAHWRSAAIGVMVRRGTMATLILTSQRRRRLYLHAFVGINVAVQPPCNGQNGCRCIPKAGSFVPARISRPDRSGGLAHDLLGLPAQRRFRAGTSSSRERCAPRKHVRVSGGLSACMTGSAWRRRPGGVEHRARRRMPTLAIVAQRTPISSSGSRIPPLRSRSSAPAVRVPGGQCNSTTR